MPHATEKDIQQYLSDGGLKLGNSLEQYLRKKSGLSVFEYMETYHGLQGTDANLKNNDSLNNMGSMGWEMMHVSTSSKYPDLVSIIWKRQKIN